MNRLLLVRIAFLLLGAGASAQCTAWPALIGAAGAAASGGGGGGDSSGMFLALLGGPTSTTPSGGSRTLTSVEVGLGSASVARGTSTTLLATAIYSDGSRSDISGLATFSSDDTNIATITGTQVRGANVGFATLQGTYAGVTGTTTITVTNATLVSIGITPAAPSVAKGTTQQFTATGTFTDSTTQDLTAATGIAWSSDDATTASIGAGTGMASANNAGSTVIRVSLGSISASQSITVTSASLVSISITPAAPSIANGLTQQFTATGTYTDATTQDITTSVTWASSAVGVATISNAAGVNGRATSVSPGATTITASLGAATPGSTTLTVTAATLSSIAVTPTNPTKAKGLTQQFTATGTYTDSSTLDITNSVTWSSDNTASATVSNTAGTQGLGTAVDVGSANISATLSGKTGSTTFTVTSATLVSIAVTPPSPSKAKGLTQQFTATGTYTDSSTQDITATVAWSSSDTGVASVSNAAGSRGLASALAAGSATITATSGAISGNTSFTVTAAVLMSISVTPTNPSVAKGLTQQFTATGTYSDSSTQDITSTVSWSSSDTGKATISNAAGSHGLATSLAAGSTTITATSGAISNNTTLTVTAATLVSIAVTPTNPSVAKGLTQQFTATGTYTDSSTQDLTASVTWSSSDTSKATISNAGGSQGLATTLAAGSTTITATSGAISNNTTLTVTAATLVSIAVTPTNPSIAKGLTQQFTATGTYTDASTQDLTTSVTWSSSDTAKATISNAGGTRGLASSVAAGSPTITATSGAVSGNTTLSITAATLVSIAVTPTNPSMAVSRTKQFTATGTYTDSTTQDLTSSVTWSSSSTSKATISNAAGSKGIASSVATGTTTITATDSGTAISGNTGLTVTAATLSSITISPVNPSLAMGYTIQFTGTGVYSDSTTQDLTSDGTCSWSSSDTSKATISNAAGSRGLATGVAVGTTTITHTCGAVSATTTLAVTAATLQGLTITPSTPTIANGTFTQFTATGTFSDNSTANLTTQVTWSSSDTGKATISNAAGSQGKATSVAAGSTTITATHAASSVSNTTTLTVTSATLSSIAVTPSGAIAIGYGTFQQFTATGTYSDGSTQNLTSIVTWSSSQTSYATISNASPTNGRATSVSAGITTITATLGAVSNTATLDVRNLVLVSIDVTPATPSVQRNGTQAFTATGTYNDSTQQDLTQQVAWTSSSVAVATISNAFGSQGIATAIGTNGQTSTISASRDGITGSTTLTVMSDITSPTVNSAVLLPGNIVQVTFSEPIPVAQGQSAGTYKIATTVTGACSDNSNYSGATSAIGISSVSVVSGSVYNLNLATGTSATTYTVLVDKTSVQDLAGNALGCGNSATFAGADTVSPVVSSATSYSGTVVRVTFSENVNATQARTASNYKIVDAPASGSCGAGNNFSGSTQTSDFSITSISGSGNVYDITISSTQTSGKSYTLLVNPGSINDLATTPNALACPNNADFTGLEQIKLSSAVCVADRLHVIASFSKTVKTGLNSGGSAECTTTTECANRYQFTGASSLGNITSVRVLDGTICGGAAADSSRVCITHDTAQGGGQYTVTVANYTGSGGDSDGFDNSAWGSIRNSGDTENIQPTPGDRRTFNGCATAPVNFSDGPIASNPFVDGSSFGYLASYGGKIYIGPNSAGNAANRFDPDGSLPESLTFRFPKDPGTQSTSSNTATTRDGGVAVPPFVTLGHSGCTTNSALIATGCGPDNENTRGLFASGSLNGTNYLFIGGGKTGGNFNYLYYTSDTDTQLDYNFIDFGSISGSNTQTFSSIAVMDSRLYMGFARQPTNRPDFGKISFNTSDTNKCTAGSSCNVVSGTHGIRLNIHQMSYLGGAAGTGTRNWANYVGVDSLFVFNNLIYAAGGGHHRTSHDGAIIRSTVINPAACTAADTCANWSEISPRSVGSWNNTNARFSLELNKVTDLIPADKAFPAFEEFNSNLYVIRNTCTVQGGNAEDSSAHSVAGCNDGTVSSRQAQLWKCTPGTSGGATTCEAGDWTLVADNGSGYTTFGNSNNKVVSMIVKNGSQLYIGFDNAVDGVQVWRTKAGVTNPSSASDFEQIGSSGFGDATNIQQIYSGLSLTQGGVNYLYVSAGKNSQPVKVFRQQN